MPGKKQVFVTGGTGYIGASVLQKLLRHPLASESELTVLVRSEDKAQKLEQLVRTTSLGDIKVLRGSNGEHDKLEAQASKSDVVFSMADADDVDAIKAILTGLKKRYEQLGVAPILIHTSGTGLLVDKADGKFEGQTFYDDTDVEQMNSIPETQIHRNVDLLVVEADKQGYARTYIILPSVIYGVAQGPLFDGGIGNRHSITVPFLIRSAVGRGQVGVVGEGLSKWESVHINDMYDNALLGRAGHGREGFYFAGNGEHKWYDLSKAIGEALFELGKVDKAEPSPFTKEEAEQSNFLWISGTNSRSQSKRGRALGWQPKYTVEDLFKSVKPEAEVLLA
ncbi:NAD(P)-binding protein [Coniophora puteana RWD-64-598 SS2]|uniref:NAD(P)-binding protein n=1 Tax=Coniophora puteana (strain RWD-64-598) TaxID=741705 RepID=A0A5M3MY36_CONPW|nr:NAD(P)-binding protein [Coniophora puteana RWD-64-598 SS2]EIW84048.1 NAD(P)-binding protein [Coniophora puteana RWD-64-598 SS2]